jgi:hypothetical protein
MVLLSLFLKDCSKVNDGDPNAAILGRAWWEQYVNNARNTLKKGR